MLRLRTFGGLTLERDGVRLDELTGQRKLLALLAVLARSSSGIGRERLMTVLWAESDMEKARGSLKQMIHALRRQLDVDIVTGTSELHLNDNIVSSDVAEFSDLFVKRDLRKAVELYRGPFLDGVYVEHAPEFSRWQDAERAELERQYMDSLEALAAGADAEGKHDEAVNWGHRLLAVDPLRARSVLALMKALDGAGEREEALRQAQVHEDLLRNELRALPDADVTRLALQIRKSTAPRRASVSNGNGDAVREKQSDVTGPQPASTSQSSPRISAGRWVFAVVLAGALLSAGLIAAMRRQRDTPIVPDGKRVVVAMFANETGDSTLNSLELLAADWMTRGVASTPGIDMLYPGVLFIQGRKPSGVSTTALELARKNGAEIAIAGTFYRNRDSLFFAASMIDASTGQLIRAVGPFPAQASSPLEGIEALRQGVSVVLATMMDQRLADFVSPTGSLPRLDAYREFLTAEDLHWHGDMVGALPHFARAGQLDTSFLLVGGRMAITAARADRCDLVDSIAASFSSRLSKLDDIERAWVLGSVAYCNDDFDEMARLQRKVVSNHPRSSLFKWTLASSTRRANHPAEATAILKTIDPDHDLGFVPGPRMFFFWRELTNAQHATGDFEGEWKSADQFGQSGNGTLVAYYYKARSFAGRHDRAHALAMIDSIESRPPEAFGSAASSRIRPIRAATTGWTLYGMSEDLLAHGYTAEARTTAARTIKWVHGRTPEEQNEPEYRLILARADMMVGEYKAAQSLLAALVRKDSANVEYIAGLGRAAALASDTATVRRTLASLATVPGQRRTGARILGRAQIASALGDTTRALALLDSLPFHLHPNDFLLLHSDAALAPLHSSRRFQELIRPKG